MPVYSTFVTRTGAKACGLGDMDMRTGTFCVQKALPENSCQSMRLRTNSDITRTLVEV